MSFDPMAAAVDWLDAYRAGDLENILKMYADDAVVHCSCYGDMTIGGKDALRVYWVDRLRQSPASELANIQPAMNGTMISYIAHGSQVTEELTFNSAGQIATVKCGLRG